MSSLYILLLFGNLLLLSYGHPLGFSTIQNLLSKFMYDVQPQEYRLKTNVKPSMYYIEIEPFFVEPAGSEHKSFTFRGNVEITIQTKDTGVKEIELHMENLILTEIKVKDSQGKLVVRDDETYVPETNKLKIPLVDTLRPNTNYIIDIDYIGELNNYMRGFYRSYYNENGKKQWVGATQFEVTHARKAFPCFDEPSFKAQFQLTVIRPIGYNLTLTNTALQESDSEEIVEGMKVREVFKMTPKMSTYLMAFVVQMFEGKQTEDKHYGVWARPGTENQLNYAFSIGDTLLNEMGTWLDYPYNNVTEIEKVDMIAVPDVVVGAMENWGAVIFNEKSLLYDETESSVADKESITLVMSHEIAHFWFGNLVTCNWWSYAWLNEGFANYMKYVVANLVQKEWNLPWKFVVDQVQKAMEKDSLSTTHPLTNPDVYTPAQASNMFGTISYRKGASILRMIEHHMGTENFQKALQKYLRDNEFQAVLPDKLFAEFDAVTPKVSETFLAWTIQSGYPVLTVTSHVNDTIKVNQKRFLLNNKDHNDKARWSIPITYANQPDHFNQTTTREIYPSTQTSDFSIKLPANPSLDFYILNVQAVGFYRVNYNKENWEAISRALRTDDRGKIYVTNRAQIVDDLLNFARSGIVTYEFALDMINYLRNEPSYIPWVSAFNGLEHLSKRIGHGMDYERFRKHIIYLTENIYNRIGFEPKPEEAQIDTLLRVHVLNWICKYGHADCITKSKEEFEKLKTDTDHIVNPNIRIPVYCTAIREGTEEDFDFLWNKYMTSNVAAEKSKILNGLACAKTENLINSYLDKILSNDVRLQDKNSSFSSSYVTNNENVDLVFNYLTTNYRKWEEVMGSVGSALHSLSDYFTTEDQVTKLDEFGKTNDLSEIDVKMIADAVASAKKNLEWDQERLVEVRNFFNQLDGDNGNSASSISFSISLILLSTVTFFYLS